MQRIISNQAPDAIGPYIHATQSNNLVFTSGQIGLDPKTNKLIEGISNQSKQVMDNLTSILETADSDLDHALKATVYLSNMDNFQAFNKVYQTYFNDSYPARTAIEVSKLPMNALIEIEIVAEVK
ncbi:Rid family detoxifying hydrolase [Companilactobacillus farciminis]|nr:Rid family detoxifying hydrolase [Companilactobacillus farciminis]